MNVSINLTHRPDHDDCDYPCFTRVDADIMLTMTAAMDEEHPKKVGYLQATIMDRKRVPENYIYAALDEHSRTMQRIGCCLLEHRRGRTTLVSLHNAGANDGDWMLIDKLHINAEHKASFNEVGARAIRELLHHPYIKGNKANKWKVTSAVYELDSKEHMTDQEKKALYEQKISEDEQEEEHGPDRIAALARQDAVPFLRNGFFQDAAIAHDHYAFLLVAASAHWNMPALKSEADVANIKLIASTAGKKGNGQTEQDTALYGLVGELVREMSYEDAGADAIKQAMKALITSGASVARSCSLHQAVANNVLELVQYLLQLEPTSINAADRRGSTPLHIAAATAAGQSSSHGIGETRVVDVLLIHGADPTLADDEGLNAYQRYLATRETYGVALQSMMGRSAANVRAMHPTEKAVAAKLKPPSGAAQLSDKAQDGPAASSGLMKYADDSNEDDDEW